MSDCLRVFDRLCINSTIPIHMTVIHYEQDDNIKKLLNITEVDLSNSKELLFGDLSRFHIEKLDKLVKSIPKKRSTTDDERKKLYSLQKSLQCISGFIYLNIKIDSKSQRRLQCSFTNFQKFIKDNPERIVAKSNTNEFRGGIISSFIESPKRVFFNT